MVTKRQRQSVISAFLGLLSEKSFAEIGLDEIATRASMSLAELRAAFDSKLAIYEAFVRDIDEAVLAADVSDMSEEPPRERLFDVLMRRLDALAPHRAALRGIARSARQDPLFAASLNRTALISQRWMLTAAGIRFEGLLGAAVTQGLVVSFARVLRVFLDEEDPGMPRTMAALDRELRRAQSSFERLERVGRLFRRPARRAPAEPRAPADPAGAAGEAA
ncbi:TetR/AcrR family transcriptional regulator [Amorphus sp. MBR-141]